MVAMGAMYQLVPVAFLTPIWNQKLWYFRLLITVVGITSLTLLLGFQPSYAVYGGILTIVGIIAIAEYQHKQQYPWYSIRIPLFAY